MGLFRLDFGEVFTRPESELPTTLVMMAIELLLSEDLVRLLSLVAVTKLYYVSMKKNNIGLKNYVSMKKNSTQKCTIYWLKNA